jgi:hypothetical protein
VHVDHVETAGHGLSASADVRTESRDLLRAACGWQLHMADLMANGGRLLGEETLVGPLRHSGFAVLQIFLSYFETIAHYEQRDPATAKPSDYFKAGVVAVFPKLGQIEPVLLDEILTTLYVGARCGLYHNSMTVPNVILGQPPRDSPMAFEPTRKVLVISPERLPPALKNHLQAFRSRLLDSANAGLRRNFERRFDEDSGIVRKAV